MLEFCDVSKIYIGGFEALHRVNLSINKGTLNFVTGHSGAGKSTLLKLLTAVEFPSSGRIYFEGKSLAHMAAKELVQYRREVGIVFQDHRLLFDRSVFENVALPLYVSGIFGTEVTRRVRAALDRVGLAKKEQCHPRSLSYGEQQRVGIARAVVNRPKLLLADEPTGNLDPGLSAEIMKLFEQFTQVGVTVVIATHDVQLIQSHQHGKAWILADGRLAA
jgi:cell division transport system ATP-binding protein